MEEVGVENDDNSEKKKKGWVQWERGLFDVREQTTSSKSCEIPVVQRICPNKLCRYYIQRGAPDETTSHLP